MFSCVIIVVLLPVLNSGVYAIIVQLAASLCCQVS